MWSESSFTTPAVAAISFCLIGGTGDGNRDLEFSGKWKE